MRVDGQAEWRNDQWVEIDDPDGVAVRVRGTLVTTIGYQLAPGAFAGVETTMALPGLPPERLPDRSAAPLLDSVA